MDHVETDCFVVVVECFDGLGGTGFVACLGANLPQGRSCH